jgi:putative colanic acid biosynthesis acetyltransferase WcaF
MQLDQYNLGDYTPGAPYWKQLLWYFLGSPLVQSYWLPWSGLKVALLRLFGATVGIGVRVKPGVMVKFPWRLSLGDYIWLGEAVWIDNIAPVTIESHVCISQGVYLCTGNHDWNHQAFKLMPAGIEIGRGSWIAARAVVGPGVVVGAGAVLTLGGVTGRSLTVYAGNPAQPIKLRLGHKLNCFPK